MCRLWCTEFVFIVIVILLLFISFCFTEPDWISLTFGSLYCIQCAGIHRSLGVHFSKIRSLLLDHVDQEVIGLVARLGNARINSILESGLPDTFQKSRLTLFVPPLFIPLLFLSSRLLRESRQKFIKDKYCGKLFCLKPEQTQDEIETHLLEAVEKQDILATQFYVTVRDSHDSVSKTKDRLPLHVACERGFADVTLFLLLNGESPNVLDSKGKSPLHYAVERNDVNLVALLLKNGADPTITDVSGKSVKDITPCSEYVSGAIEFVIIIIVILINSSFSILGFKQLCN